jgi:hypothetical protein
MRGVDEEVPYTTSIRRSRPIACAARARVCSVAEALPGSRRRSDDARLVFMRRAISTLLTLSFSIACWTCHATVSFQHCGPGLFKDAFSFQEVIQRRTYVLVAPFIS